MKTLLRSLCLFIFVFQANFAVADGGYFFEEDDHGHAHTPHDGVLAAFTSPDGGAGNIELKLHDDKGDLELWLTSQKKDQPYDLPLNAVLTVTFPELDNKAVNLQVRNTEKNEDEDGKTNIRGNKTNYFIFPGDTGADPSFLLGKEFSSKAVVSFSIDGKQFRTEPFVLFPHTHAH